MQTTQERRLSDRRSDGRRVEDVKLKLLEDSLKELPRYFLAYSDPQKGVYSFFYSDLQDAETMVRALIDEGIPEHMIGLYERRVSEE
ncbi:MAG: hypothetical protein IT461_11865 [Planctomycetes bacterium]|jgi:hypothetical protein|nr:hypothetical protein [Planctomycetota bacterium]